VILLGQRDTKQGQDPIPQRWLERTVVLLHCVLDACIERLHQTIENIEVV
jgi:hypothetical protein